MKSMYVDVGELGWSLYLSAHMRWLKKNTDDYIGVTTHADRHCLYRDVVDATFDMPDDYYTTFKRGREVYFGLRGASPAVLCSYFAERIPSDYELLGYFGYKIKWSEVVFGPYSYSKALNGKKEILVFPRCRNSSRLDRRNLPEHFYAKMIGTLCDKYPDHIIRAIGIPTGAYNINGMRRDNYINNVREGADLQEMIDRCQIARAAVGSQSAPPKLTLLQGVPTFMIGHQQSRHISTENWMSTKVEFYETPKKDYGGIDVSDCIKKILSFVEGC